jgi:hypothetical protein
MPPLGFEPTTPVCKRPQNCGLYAQPLGPAVIFVETKVIVILSFMLFVFVEQITAQGIFIFVQMVLESAGAQIFQKSRIHLKRSRPQKGNKKKFHTKDPQILGATVQNFAHGRPCARNLYIPWIWFSSSARCVIYVNNIYQFLDVLRSFEKQCVPWRVQFLMFWEAVCSLEGTVLDVLRSSVFLGGYSSWCFEK